MLRIRSILCAATLVVTLASCQSSPGQQQGADERSGETQTRVRDVSLIRLLANPESFRGEVVRVKGFGVIEFEYNAVMLSEGDASHGILKNGIWLRLSPDEFEQYSKYTRRYLLVEGTFVPEKDEHYYGTFGGVLEDISRLEPLTSIQELEAE